MITSAEEFAREIKRAELDEVMADASLVGLTLLAIEDKLFRLVRSIQYFGNKGRSITIDLSDMADKFSPGVPYAGLPLEAYDPIRDKLKGLGFECALHTTEKTALKPSRIFRIIVAIPHDMIEAAIPAEDIIEE